MVWSVDSEELVSQSLSSLAKSHPLDFKELDTVTSFSLTFAKKVHSFIVEL